MRNNFNNKSSSPSQGDHRGSRYRSSIINIGTVPLGGSNPVRLQSMTNTNTLDTRSSVAQCIRIIEAGADFVRLTAQGRREVENLANIRKELLKAGFSTPLIADIHFNPEAAIAAAGIVEKIRINPGNYADKRASFEKHELTAKQYDEELERIHRRLLPLIEACRLNKTVIRIGINYGSLSDRIMTRYGNTPEGMVWSAMEYIEIFRSENFNDLVLSMKSSDTGVMVEATRSLVEALMENNLSYPIHLGVTEAGEGEDGRVRSAAGIGTLLTEGIGDTIRVSLSEDPENEIPVAREILNIIGGPAGRIETPRIMPAFKMSDRAYSPEVITFTSGHFIAESGEQFKGKITTFNADSPPVIETIDDTPLFLNPLFNEDDPEKLAIHAAALVGGWFILRQAAGICLTNKGNVQGEKLSEIAFSILQATEARITRNRYISCPTCGRTNFDLQEAVRRVKAITGHLTGLRIAVMGCIVNGPGEMAGSDYGYVGASEGKVHIYRGTVPVLKNVPQESAPEKLLEIIEQDQRE